LDDQVEGLTEASRQELISHIFNSTLDPSALFQSDLMISFQGIARSIHCCFQDPDKKLQTRSAMSMLQLMILFLHFLQQEDDTCPE
jgi:hypothetical protein